MQPDRGLAAAGRALHADRLAQLAPHQHVLFGLDGGDDVPHRAGAGPLDLGGQNAAGTALAALATVRRTVARRVARRRVAVRRAVPAVRAEGFVLQPGQLLRCAQAPRRPAEPAAPREPERSVGARLVERPGDRGPPVDHQRRHRRILGDPPAAHVVALSPVVPGLRGVGEVEAAEEGRALRQLRHPLGAGAQVPAERLRAGTVAGDVLRGDDLVARVLDLPGRRDPADLDVGPLPFQFAVQVPDFRGHRSRPFPHNGLICRSESSIT